jgi:hypothetical protein
MYIAKYSPYKINLDLPRDLVYALNVDFKEPRKENFAGMAKSFSGMIQGGHIEWFCPPIDILLAK